ncbi:hypothetical protein N0V83_001056 [Neocucurbitaria cava]|uniref:Uncharacterized protein n=1 Tax=Neocucurbitaria cava TaxID=798079 RepID=A0A9W8YGG2_9PLEO|nr:hypothetical protein N0V83_001056 [Neocucurbitaria cava]
MAPEATQPVTTVGILGRKKDGAFILWSALFGSTVASLAFFARGHLDDSIEFHMEPDAFDMLESDEFWDREGGTVSARSPCSFTKLWVVDTSDSQ